VTYAPNTDLAVPYAETTDDDRTYRNHEAMRALAEVRCQAAEHGDALVPIHEKVELGYAPPCEDGGPCLWGISDDEQAVCCNPEKGTLQLPCAGGWWFVCTGDDWDGVFALHPSDAILLAARKVCGE